MALFLSQNIKVCLYLNILLIEIHVLTIYKKINLINTLIFLAVSFRLSTFIIVKNTLIAPLMLL